MNEQTPETGGKFSWPGFIVGLVVGAGLFYATIQLVSALMFSRTAAELSKGVLKWAYPEEIF